MNKVNFPSRYRDVETSLEVVEDNKGIITTNGVFVRHILNKNTDYINPSNTIIGIDFEGGPMIKVGDNLKEYGFDKTVKSIRGCYLVEFE